MKLFLTREETYLCVGNRPPSNMKLKAGVKKDGTLTALEFTCLGTGGAYPAGGTSPGRLAGPGPLSMPERPLDDDRCLYQCRSCTALSGPRATLRGPGRWSR